MAVYTAWLFSRVEDLKVVPAMIANFHQVDLSDSVINKLHRVRLRHAVEDPGFPRGGGANRPGRRGCQHTIMPKFPKNFTKLKEFGA